MKPTNKIRGFIGGMVMGMLLFSATFSQAEEIKLLKVNAQKGMGSAILEAGRLGRLYGHAQESLGMVIREGGPEGKIDQALFGKGIAEAASLKWQVGRAEETLGSAIAKAALIVSKKTAITGKEAVQGRLGAGIQAKAQREWAASEEAKSFTATRVAALQEEQGSAIQKRARFNWAEGEVATAIRAAHLPGKVSEPIPSEVLFPLRSMTGFEFEENLRLALTLMENEKGMPFTELLPAPVSIVSTGITKYTVVGGERGLGTFASLLGFAWAMAMFSWALTDPDRARIVMKKERRGFSIEETYFKGRKGGGNSVPKAA